MRKAVSHCGKSNFLSVATLESILQNWRRAKNLAPWHTSRSVVIVYKIYNSNVKIRLLAVLDKNTRVLALAMDVYSFSFYCA